MERGFPDLGSGTGWLLGALTLGGGAPRIRGPDFEDVPYLRCSVRLISFPALTGWAKLWRAYGA